MINNKGFAISTMIYGLLILASMIFFLILATMSGNIKSSNDFVDHVETELDNCTSNGSC